MQIAAELVVPFPQVIELLNGGHKGALVGWFLETGGLQYGRGQQRAGCRPVKLPSHSSGPFLALRANHHSSTGPTSPPRSRLPRRGCLTKPMSPSLSPPSLPAVHQSSQKQGIHVNDSVMGSSRDACLILMSSSKPSEIAGSRLTAMHWTGTSRQKLRDHLL